MKNTHIEHPEDSILTGDLSVLAWFCYMKGAKASLKIDGAPAIVWGKNPASGNFFVGTKSVFNKKKIKINESHEDINRNHEGNVANILHACFDWLPGYYTERPDEIYQGDFIGFGGEHTYQPNVLVYSFPEVVEHEIIIAPHTVYDCPTGILSEAIASALDHDLPEDTDVLWVKPEVDFYITPKLIQKCNFARQMAQLVTFTDAKGAKELKKDLNQCIREGIDPVDDNGLISYWKLIKSIKHYFIELFAHDADFTTFIYDGDTIQQTDGEGYVMWNSIGTYKLVDREVFSHANFNQTQFGRV
tara:strand:- start:1167 stop:2072 length:906 start_codon:yes stop_codon:yes gene_type:complete